MIHTPTTGVWILQRLGRKLWIVGINLLLSIVTMSVIFCFSAVVDTETFPEFAL